MRLKLNKPKIDKRFVVKSIIRIVLIAATLNLAFYLGQLKGEKFGFDVGYVTGTIHVLMDPESALATFDEIKKRNDW